jgi:hypothetical protein
MSRPEGQGPRADEEETSPARARPLRISETLNALAGDGHGETTLGEIVGALGDRGYGILMFVLAVPNLLPIYVPGLSAVLGIPLALVALQMTLGLPRPWLPATLLRRSISRREVARVVTRLMPWLRRLERVLKPRLPVLFGPVPERLVGLNCLLLAIALALPIPLTGLPLGVAIGLVSAGLVERDGLVTMAGIAASALAVLYSGLLTVATFEALLALFNRLIGG